MALERTSVSEPGVASSAPNYQNLKPTKTRWWILLLISIMYLICYMDRSNISVAAPEIAKAFGLDKAKMGVILAAFTWAYALGQVPARMVWRPLRAEKSFDRDHGMALHVAAIATGGALSAFRHCSARASCWASAKQERFP